MPCTNVAPMCQVFETPYKANEGGTSQILMEGGAWSKEPGHEFGPGPELYWAYLDLQSGHGCHMNSI